MPPKRKTTDSGPTSSSKKSRRGSASGGTTTPSVDDESDDGSANNNSNTFVADNDDNDNDGDDNNHSNYVASTTNPGKGGPALSIDTSELGTASTGDNNTSNNLLNSTTYGGGTRNETTTTITTLSSTSSRATTKTPPGGGMDSHPYARGAVIEVLHGVEERTLDDEYDDDGNIRNEASDDDWWERDSSLDDDEEQEEEEEGYEDEDENGENENDAEDDDDDDDDGADKDNDDSEMDKKKKKTTKAQDESSQQGSQDDDEDDDDNKNDALKTKQLVTTATTTKKKKRNTRDDKPHITVRLCDIIDRVAIGDGKYRYYVHYRDFNRRMDEWVSMGRIVSPPSVGNAKARALKKEEEKRKKQQQREQEKRAEEAVDVSAPRASRRRSTQYAPNQMTATGADNATAAGATGGTPGAEGEDGGGTTRRRRRRTTAGGGADVDDATVVAGNQGEGGASAANGGSHPNEVSTGPIMAAEKGIVALPTAVVAQVGEHVVQTIEAQELDEHEGLDEASLREHEEVTKVKNVAFIELGPFQMETWYFSPLPKEVLSENGFIEVLYVCEFTFHMFARKSELRHFQSRLPTSKRHPPGNEIYRCGNLSMFEVDGFEERIYCQNLCYIAKLFLDHKTLYFDVDPFLFYVLCEVDERGHHPTGYFSKEKYSDVGFNLACILVFPSHQRKGYGRFLIAFSYELSKKEEKVGSPEKPMSDLGQQAYKPYWASTIVDFLLNQCPDARSMSIMDISKMTSIMAEDIVFTLNQLGILKIINGVYFIAAEEGLLKTLAKKYPVKEPRVDASKLHWSPFITDVKRDKFSIHSKKPSVEGEETRGAGGFP